LRRPDDRKRWVWAILALTVTIGLFLISRYGPERELPRCVCENPDGTLVIPQTPEALARRNVVWQVMNGAGNDLPPSAERRIGEILTAILDPNSDTLSRNLALQSYLQKSTLFFTEQRISELAETLADGSPAERLGALRLIAAADKSGAELISSVLADTERLHRFFAGIEIPLETLPDGRTP